MRLFELARFALCASLVAGAALIVSPAAAAETTFLDAVRAASGAPDELSPALAKVRRSLRRVAAQIGAALSDGAAGGRDLRSFSNRSVHVDEEGAIQVDIYWEGRIDEARVRLAELGVRVELANAELKIVQGWVPHGRLDELASMREVVRVTPPSYGTTQVGSVTTFGDDLLRGPEVRARGYDGSGVRVGVISDGVDSLETARASGDLPEVSIVFTSGRGDEGTAMLEIVHDIAPGAELAFCGGKLTLAHIQCVLDLQGQFGADIIVDDYSHFGEPFFEDGPLADVVAEAVANGVIVVSAAGNAARRHYQAEFAQRFQYVVFDGETYLTAAHSFSSGVTTMPVEIVGGEDALITLQWSNAFGHASDDLDLCLLDETGMEAIECSFDDQDGDDDPVEMLTVSCGGTDGCVRSIIVMPRRAVDDLVIELFFSDEAWPLDYGDPADSVFGHKAVPGVVSAGAIDALDRGQGEPTADSSWGPSTILFPAYEARAAPTLCGIDNVAVSGAGGWPPENPGIFHGTSAAAPHIAGVAALLLGASGRSASEIVDAMSSTAVDLGAAGWDYASGAGRLDALVALELLVPEAVNDGAAEGHDGCGGCASLHAGGGAALLSALGLLALPLLRSRLTRTTRARAGSPQTT